MLSKLLSPTGPGGSGPSSSRPSQPPTTPPASSSVNGLLSPASASTTTNNKSSSSNGSSNKRKAQLMDTSPHKSRSPSKVPRTPEGKTVSVAASPRAGLASRGASLNNLLNAEDRPPRLSNAPSVDADDMSVVEADVVMHEGDRDEGEEDDVHPAEHDEDGDDDDDDDDEDDDEDDDDDEDSGDDSDSDSSEIVVLDGPTTAGEVFVKSEPVDGAAVPESADVEAPVADVDDKPKKKGKRRRRESTVDDLPPPPPPMPTIRIEVPYKGGDDTLDFNFIERATQAGYTVVNAFGEGYMQHVEEPPTVAETSNNTPAPAEAAPPARSGGPMSLQDMLAADPSQLEEMARKYEEEYEKPRARRDVYNLNDPFIDDSDLMIDAPTHIARPKKEGFFVHSGVLELVMDESAHARKSRAKPKARKEAKEPRKSLSEALRMQAAAKHIGSRDSPILIDSDHDDVTTAPYMDLKRSPSPENEPLDLIPVDRSAFKSASREPKYLPPFNEFPDDVAHRLRVLRRQSLVHRWDPATKGKFPEHLKPALIRAGEAAFRHDMFLVFEKDYNDSLYEASVEKAFVTALCSILPYNRLTLGKLVMKLCYPMYWRWLKAREDEGLRQWKELLEPEIPGMIAAYEKEVADAEAAPVEEPETTEDGEKKAPVEIKKTPVFTQDMKDIFRQLVENTQEMVDVNRKMEDWNQRIEGQSSELNMRKFMYTRIINMYPEGYMTSLALSRAFTNIKRAGQGAKAREEAAAAANMQ